MAKLTDVCSYIRSKNAGPFWVTIDLFFRDAQDYRRYRDSDVIGPTLFASLYGVDPALVRRTPVDNLRVIKVSFARQTPQGGVVERDMHSGQMFARLLKVELREL